MIDVLKVESADFVSHYTVKCPLFETVYIEQNNAKKLMSDAKIEMNNLKLLRISPELVIKYQRVFMH